MDAQWNEDIVNAYILQLMGVDMSTLPTSNMPDWEYNALSFAQANDMTQLVGTPEAQWAIHFIGG